MTSNTSVSSLERWLQQFNFHLLLKFRPSPVLLDNATFLTLSFPFAYMLLTFASIMVLMNFIMHVVNMFEVYIYCADVIIVMLFVVMKYYLGRRCFSPFQDGGIVPNSWKLRS